MGKVYLTAKGLTKLRQELDELINEKRPALADRLHHAIQQGDLSENADYQTAKEEQAFLEGRIQELESMLLDAVVIEENQGPHDQVALGSQVTVVEDGEEEPEVFVIVGPAESDPTNGRISNESPIGRALLAHRVGDRVAVRAPAGEIIFEILSID